MLFFYFKLPQRNSQEQRFVSSEREQLLQPLPIALTWKPSHRRAVLRSQVLRATASRSPIPPHIFHAISLHLDEAFAAGKYLKDGPLKQGEAPPAAPNILSDPGAMDGMMAGMKTQMVMMIPQMVIMGWINFFFQGFVLSKCSVPKSHPPASGTFVPIWPGMRCKSSSNGFSTTSDIRTPDFGSDSCERKNANVN